jgi:hypothetical protein
VSQSSAATVSVAALLLLGLYVQDRGQFRASYWREQYDALNMEHIMMPDGDVVERTRLLK